MPKFTVGEGYFADFDAIPLATANGAFVVMDDHLIRIATAAGDGRPAGFESYIGDFTYTGEGLPLGTIDTYRFDAASGAPVYRIADAGISVEGLRKAAETGDPQAFLRLIFRHDDRLLGGALDDTMRGYAREDLLAGRGGDDVLSGMGGRDRLKGHAGDDLLQGGAGRDVLRGGAGDDRLDGGAGRNLLEGGAGADTFVFLAPGKPARIADFAPHDRIALGFAGLGPEGPLDPARFHRGSEALTTDQKILYDAGSGWLLYARHGSGTHDPVRVAKVGKDLDHIDAGDFLVL